MAAPVWVLSVDLQTKTATFQSGMAEAAKSARGAFTDIKTGAGEMGGAVGSHMSEARHGVMMLGEEFGIHLPRGLTTFIASLGPVGAAMEAAFPFLAIALGATLLIEHLVKMHEANEKLTSDQVKFGTSVQTAFNSLDQKLLQAGIRSDELRNDHLGALQKQLALINKQSMAELVQQFGVVSKAADTVFAGLKKSWYEFGTGSRGAKHALDEFQQQYDDLLAKGKNGEATDLLRGTRESAEKVLAMQKQAAGNHMGAFSKPKGYDESKDIEATNALKKAGVGFTKDEISAQEALVQTLAAQVGVEQKVADLKKAESGNATRSTAGAQAAEQSQAARAAVESQLRMSEQVLTAAKASSGGQMAIKRASIQERMQADIAFADRELQIQLDANKGLIGALDKYAKDYPNQLKALHEKAEELTAEHATKITEITAKSGVEQNAKDLADMEQGIREKIDATQQGSAARLAAIDAGIRAEAAKNMQDLAGYRELMSQRVMTARQMAEEEAKLREETGIKAAASEEKTNEAALAAQREHIQMMDSMIRASAAMRLEQEINLANAVTAIKMTTAEQDIAALDKSGKDYANKFKALQDQKKQLVQQNETEITSLKDRAEMERNQRMLAAEQRAEQQVAQGLTQSIMGHQTWAHMISGFASQAATELIKNSLMVMMQQEKGRLSDARKAATSAYSTGEGIGGPAGLILGPVFAAAAFAGAMAFEGGGIVPGVGRGDVVPAMLTPGEGIIPGSMMSKLNDLANSGGMGGGGNHTHIHASFAPKIHALDGDGVDHVLQKHADKFQKHIEHTVRRMNR